jgi:hypothetical protein
MEATRRPPTTLKGLSRFLVEHEPCGAGFDVFHPAGLGSGRVSMTCRGCGATYEYATATIEFEREVEFEPVGAGAADPGAAPAGFRGDRSEQPAAAEIEAPAAAAAVETEEAIEANAEPPAPEEASDEKKGGRPRRRLPKGWTRDRTITGGLLLFSAAALAFAVIRLAGDSGESTEPTEAPPPAATAPAKHPQPAPTPPPPHPAKSVKPTAQQPPRQAHPAPDERVVKTAHFTVKVPPDWTQRPAAGGGILLAPPDSTAVSLQIFYEDDPSLSVGKMSVQTAAFLSSRDPQAAVSAAKTLRVGGHRAFEVSANGPAGAQRALGVIADPYRYLAIVSADPGTAGSERETAVRAMRSLRPR